MNELHHARLDDDQVIARLRAALDEVTAESNTDDLVPSEPQDHTMSAGRWMAIAAAMVLVVGAVAVFAINRRNAPYVASTPTETAAPSTTAASAPTGIWYTLASPDLVPGKIVTLPNLLPADEVSIVWSFGGNPADGLLVLRSGPGSPDLGPADTSVATYRMIDEQAIAVASYGLTPQEQADLTEQIRPGSGLPWLLPVEGWAFMGMGVQLDGLTYEQTYSADNGAVGIDVGPLFNQFFTLATVGNLHPVTIAGRDGWMASNADGVYALWPAGDSGAWASMTISAQLANRADGLIAAVAEVGANTPTVETVPVPDTVDTPAGSVAVGEPAPSISGETLTGYTMSSRTGASVLLVFVQPACTPCAAAVSSLASATTASSWPVGISVELVIQPPASKTEAAAWLSDNNWTGDVILDREGVTSQAFAAKGAPSYVLIGSRGYILAIHDGALDDAGLRTLVTPQSPSVLGSFDIPTIAANFSVFDASGFPQSAVLAIGPSLILGPSPSTPGSGLDPSVVVATRSTFGTGVLSDLVKIGDQLEWTGPDGTQMYEVVWTEVCTGADCGTTEPYTLIIELVDGPDRIYAKPVG